ncbi:flavodoxin [Acholeplasma equirhinis]|uniref:flavodoxin n=1 Tax=Acholeplasma equirhinis TaxID=555393 RepID=UPI00197AB18C|nr:flavodoxin [Acholeplasma equirhinis]MBN3490809.1 flavodoxin [Acholeplasma equirhinis]
MAILVVYWTGTGNTEIMAEKIYEGIQSVGVDAELKLIDQVSPSDIDNYEKIAFGCPSMGIEELEPDEFLPWYEEIEPLLQDKLIALFGSYGWGEGEWMDAWHERVRALGLNLFEEGIRISSTPSTKEQQMIFEFGQRFAQK